MMDMPTKRGPRRRAILLTASGAGLGMAVSAGAQQERFPARPLTLVVPTPAGGGTDFAARLVAGPLGALLGQTVVVENRTGGNDVVGLSHVVRSAADGHTLLMGYSGTMAGRAALDATGGISTSNDFVPIGQVSDTPQLFVVHPSVPARTLSEFVAHVRANPGKVSYASAGAGSLHHLGTELLKARTGMDMLHVPYRGTGETIADLIAGRVQFYMNSPPPLVPLVRDGRVRALCVSSDERHPGLPEVPSLTEANVPELRSLPLNVWFSVFAPKGVPAAVQRQLATALEAVVTDEAVRRRGFEAGALVRFAGPEEVAARLRAETAAWRETARTAGIRLE